MKIQEVQSCQTNFGTKVRMSSTVANIIAESKNKSKILKQIQMLEQNGKNDIFTLTGNNFTRKSGNIGCVNGEITNIFKGKRNEQPYMTKTRGAIDIEEIKASYDEITNPDYQVWEPKKIKLSKGLEKFFPYLI